MKRKEVKKGSEIECLSCNSLLNKMPIEGKVFFDSWEGSEHCFVCIPGEPSGKRFMIESKNLILED